MSGIDYGNGQTNVDHETGIRYGVIPMCEVELIWPEDSEEDYGPPTCPVCGELLDGLTCECDNCDKVWEPEECYPESPLGWSYKGDGIQAVQSGEGVDIFVTKSPFYTRAQFCSPCAPGACYLLNSEEDGTKAYCFGHDWFEGEAPYPVYRVEDDTLVVPPAPEGS